MLFIKRLNPVILIGSWVISIIVFDVMAIPMVTSSGSGMQQLVYFLRSVNVMMYGIFVLSIITPFLFREWFRKRWFINLFFFFLSGVYIFPWRH